MEIQKRDRVVTEKPLVSVIIPTHNRPESLARALDSVFAQEGLGKEFDLDVIVIDDASTDSTPDVARRYPDVRYIRLATNRGVSGARNVGLTASRGTLVAFLDDDDVWLAWRLRTQVSVMTHRPETVAVYSQAFHTLVGKAWPETFEAVSGWTFEAMLRGIFFCIHTVLVRREAFEKVGYFDETLSCSEDWDMWLRLSVYFPFVFVPGVVAVYVVSPHGLWQRNKGDENCARVIEKALRLLPDSPHYAEFKQTARARVALEYGRTLTDVLEALRTYPSVVRYGWARKYVSFWASKAARRSESPISAARDVCAQVRAAIPVRGARGRWRVRKTLAGIWAEVANSLARRPGRERDAAHAAAYAVAHAPEYLVGWKLTGIIGRGILASGPTPHGPR